MNEQNEIVSNMIFESEMKGIIHEIKNTDRKLSRKELDFSLYFVKDSWKKRGCIDSKIDEMTSKIYESCNL